MNFDTYISHTNLSENTKKTYSMNYINYLEQFENGNKMITKELIPAVVEYIGTLDKSNNTKMMLIAILINLMNFSGYNTTEIKKIQNNLFETKKKETVTRKNEKEKVLPSKKTIELFMKKQLKEENYRSYIINYLLLNFNVRNMDLDVEIIFKKKDMNDTDNFLLVRATDVIYIRNNYKTFKNYGKKIFKIRSRPFTRACQRYVENGETTLFKTNSNLTYEVSKYTYEGLSESDYLKIVIDSIDFNKDFRKLDMISERRGTSTSVLISEYSIKVK
jgi:hypothetical protein